MTTPLREGAHISAAIAGGRQMTGEIGALTGMRLGDYELRDVLGIGGMAEVYRALDAGLERDIAVKVLSGPLASDTGYVTRFREEARRVAALNHPHIVPIYAFGEERGLLYLVMPVVPGSLRDRLMQVGRLPADKAVELVLQVASALEAAHAAGFVHRDVKPENILLDAQGQVLLTDFGIAREVTVLRQAGTMRTLSATGLPVGTPEYMAPEQLRGESADQRVDIYALGAVLYELLTGVVPHEAPTPYEVAALALMAPLTPPSTHNPQIGRSLERVVMRALARAPEDRYPDVRHFVAALQEAMAVPASAGAAATADATPDAEKEDTAPILVARMPGSAVRSAPTSGALPLAGSLTEQQDLSTTLPSIERVVPPWRAAPRHLIWPLPQITTGPASQRSRFLLAALAALLLLILATGGTFAALRGLGRQPTGGVSTSVSTHVTHAASTATATHARPTAKPTATEVPAPVLALTLAPSTLVLSSGSHNSELCIVTQRITNTSSGTVGWSWQPPSVSGFYFVLNNRSLDSWPSDTKPGIAPGGSDKLQIVANCSSHHEPVTVQVADTLGGRYTLTVQVQQQQQG